jgi:two-component system nitrogen regulation response regulator GlnG
VRELENLVRRLAVLCSEEIIGESVIQSELEDSRRPVEGEPVDETLSGAVARHVDRYFAAHDDELPPPGLYARILEELERPLITRTLQATRGNQLRAADILGLNRNTLRKKIRELDIHLVRSP